MTIPARTHRVLLSDNPWLQGEDPRRQWERRLPTSLVGRAAQLEPSGKVALVVGPRFAGKSTLVATSVLRAGRPTLLLDAAEPAVAHWLRAPADLLEDLGGLLRGTPDLFLREVGRLEEPGRFLQGLVDRAPGVAIYASASSAFDLQARHRVALAGRAHRTLLLPLSLGELSASGPARSAPGPQELAAVARQMQLTGGFPAVAVAPARSGPPGASPAAFAASPCPHAPLAGLVEELVAHVASDRVHLRHPAALELLLSLAASHIGRLCNLSEWAARAGISHGTANGYLQLLQACYVVALVPAFVGGRRAEVTAARKVYFHDNGVRNQIFGGFGALEERGDRRALLQNLVFSEIAKAIHPLLDTVAHWRTRSGAEVDFVVQQRGRLTAIDARADDPRARIGRSARSFIQAYEPDRFVVVSPVRHPPQQVGPTEVLFATVHDVAPLLREQPA